MATNRVAAFAVVVMAAVGVVFARLAPARGQDATPGTSPAATSSPAASATPEAAASPANAVGAVIINTGPPPEPLAPEGESESEPQ
jgi:hypothetical protein